MDEFYSYLIRNVDYEEDEQPEPLDCICPEHFGSTPAYCEACGDWTDNLEYVHEVPYSEERAAEDRLLLENFYLVLAETRTALNKGRK